MSSVGLQAWINELMAMTPDERSTHFRDSRLDDFAELSPEKRAWFEAELEQHRDWLQSDQSPPLRIVDQRKRKPG